MAGNIIKGLTVEIGGDTTKLGKALEDVNKKSSDLSGELGAINKLLKLDPKNTELVAQKQKVLAAAISNTREKLDTLKKAEKQVQKQFEKGEVSEEQVRALQREIVATSKKLEGYEKAAKEAGKGNKKLGESAKDAGDASEGLGKKLSNLAKGGLKAVAAGITASIGALIASAEATRDYRLEMGKLDTAFQVAGHSSQTATATYKELQGIIGETDQAVEASQQIALLANSEKEAAEWASYAAGVVGRFGDALQPETFYESANETLKLGEATGAFTQMLEGTGFSVDKFNMELAQFSTESEKQQYMLRVTKMLLGDAATKYNETNAEIIRANQANEEWTSTMAEAGALMEPILTDIKLFGASLLADMMPGIEGMTEGFRGMLNGDTSGAEQMGSALSGIVSQLLDTLTNMLPMITTMSVSLVSSLTSSLLGLLPKLVTTGTEVVLSLLKGITSALPQIVAAIINVVPQLVSALATAIPQLLEGVMTALTSLVSMLTEQLPVLIPLILETITSLVSLLIEQTAEIIPQVLDLLVSLVTLLVEQLPILIPQVVQMVVQIIQLLAAQLPSLITHIVDALVTIIEILVEQLPVIIPMLIEACITIVLELIKALPDILVALIEALPKILQAVWDAIVMVFENIPEWFGQLFQGAVDIIKEIWSVVVGFFSEIWDGIKGVFASVGQWFSDIFTSAWNGIKKAWNSVGKWFSDLWGDIKRVFASVGSFFSNIFSSAWKGIKNAFSAVGDFFSGIFDSIKEIFSTIGNEIGDAVSGAFKSAINWVLEKAIGLINGFISAINACIGAINLIPGVEIKKIKELEVPEFAEGGVVTKPTAGIFGEDGAEAVVPLERNTEWIRRVAQEFLGHVKNEAGVDAVNNGNNIDPATGAPKDNWMNEKLDKILDALEKGQVLTIDGRALVGATATRMDTALGQRRALAARGAM